MNILIKLMSIVSLVIAPYIASTGGGDKKIVTEEILKCNVNGIEYTCTSRAQCDSIMNSGKQSLTELNGNYLVDQSHSYVEFSLNHNLSKSKGSIAIDSGIIQINKADLKSSRIFVLMGIKSINTQSKDRDEHLKTSDFFHADSIAVSKFESTSIDTTSGEYDYKYIAHGNLTLRGITKPVDVWFNYLGKTEVKDKEGKVRANIYDFDGEAMFNRLDFKIGTESKSLGSEIKVHINLESYQEAEKK